MKQEARSLFGAHAEVYVCMCVCVCVCVHAHACVCVLSLQWCPILCNPLDCSLPGSSIQGILQAGILEWIAMPSSSVSF